MQNNKIALIMYLVFSMLLSSCEKPTDTKPTKSVSDYTWTIDTLELPDPFQNLMSSMYAVNEGDIYLVGHNSTGDLNGGMWHYDGDKWATVKLREQVGAFGTLKSIDGSSPNNIWAVGGTSNYATILQYDGANWKKHLAETSDGMYGTPISEHDVYSVYVVSETEVYACGDGGLVYYYDGNSWDVDSIKINLNENEKFSAKDIILFNSELMVLGFKHFSGNFFGTYYILKRNKQNWMIQDSIVQGPQGGTEWKWGTGHFYLSSSNQLYTLGFGGVFQFNGSTWTNIFTNETPINGISVKNENNILIVGDFGLVFHYNGQNWERLSTLDFADIYTCVWQNSDEAIIVGQLLDGYPQKTIVVIGK